MKKNMGTWDRRLRISAALLFAILYFAGVITGTWAIVLMIVAGVFLLTSIVSVCPLYSILGINTCPRRQN